LTGANPKLSGANPDASGQSYTLTWKPPTARYRQGSRDIFGSLGRTADGVMMICWSCGFGPDCPVFARCDRRSELNSFNNPHGRRNV
jgi:hypothetical protein